MTGPWLVPWHPRPYQPPVLLCLPSAGAGCGQFRPWQTFLGDEVSVVGVQLPGRETRWTDPVPSTMDDVIESVVLELGEQLRAGHSVVVFGHSFGALLGYEITKRLAQWRGQWPCALVVAACRPPHMWVGAGRGLIDSEDELARLVDGRTLEQEDLDEDTRQLMVEVLRQDVQLSLTYTDPGGVPVGCPLEVWSGDQDEIVPADDLTGWRDYAGTEFRRRRFPGGHYFCVDPARPFLSLLRQLVVGNPGMGREEAQ